MIINKNYNNPYTYEPKSFNELREIIEQRYKEQGPGTEKNPIDLNDIDISNIYCFWDKNIEKSIFEEIEFEYIDVSDWDVSGVKDISYMFDGCEKLKSAGNLSKWDVSSVEDMQGMFYECENLKSVGNLSKWDVSSVRDISYMFYGCNNLKSVGNLSKWKIVSVEDAVETFSGCEKLKSVGDLSKWDVSNAKNMERMFVDSGITNIPDWYEE